VALATVRCGSDARTGPGDPTSRLELTAATTGDDLDPNGYTATLDGSATQQLPTNGSVTFSNLSAGSHTIRVADVAANCAVQGNHPRTIVVQAGQKTSTTVEITCAGLTGDLDVSVSTTGEDIDPNGYMVSVTELGVSTAAQVSADADSVPPQFTGQNTELEHRTSSSLISEPDTSLAVTEGATAPAEQSGAEATESKRVDANGSVTFSALPDGRHSVELADLAPNCTVSGSHAMTIEVPPNGTASLQFDIECVRIVGALSVAVSTSGEDVDADGYTVIVDGTASRPVGLNETVVFSGLDEGDHSVELIGLASNCVVMGANPVTVAVPPDGSASTAFAVDCSSLSSGLDVTVTTTGSALDPNGYTVTVDDTLTQSVAVNGTVTFFSLPVGDHTVRLADVQNNCSVTGANPVTVSMPPAGAASVEFQIICSDRTGDLEVSVSSTGDDLDADGYAVVVDGTQTQSVGSNGVVTFSGLAEGDHTVELAGLADNCSVTGSNPQTITVPFAGTASAVFAVSCVPRVADLQVSTSTTGVDLDPDGYTVTVDSTLSQPIDPSGTALFTALPEGQHLVELSGLAANCTVSGDNPVTVMVTFGTTAATSFTVDCAARTGSAAVTVTTTGIDLDPDGYEVTVDGEQRGSVDVNGTLTVQGIAEGDHVLELTGVAGNCTVTSPNPVTVAVPHAGTATATWTVECVERLGNLQVVAVTTGEDPDPDGYTVTLDGAQSQAVAPNDTVTFIGLTEGDHTVELSGAADNCTVADPNPITVTVPFDSTGLASFIVDCSQRTGDLEVIVNTTGVDRDLGGYRVSIDGGAGRPVASNDTTTFVGLAEGDHTVELLEIQTNCAVAGDHPVTVTIPFRGTVNLTLTVECVERVGTLEVMTVTTGVDFDTAYTITVDLAISQTASPNDTLTFADLSVGTHTIEITGVAGNCTLTGDRIIAISVPYQETVAHTYELSCTERLGDLRISTATTGNDPDPDGYTATVNDTLNLALASNDAIVVTGFHEGDHTIELSGVIENCAVSSTNPAIVAVPYADTVTAAFTIDCATRTGTLDVGVTTTGTDLDPDGYSVTVDGTDSQTIAVDGTVTYAALTEGDHSVELAGQAGNCSVTSPNPVTVTVPYEGSAAANFTVDCVERLGDLEVITSTTGGDLDPDGYTVTVDGTQSQPIDTVGTVTFVDLDEGDHSVELTGLQGNCTVTSMNPVTVSVSYAATATTTFTIDCATRTGDLNVSVTTTGIDLDPDGYTATVDGTESQSITVDGTVTFTGLAEGDHSVELVGIEANCSLTSPSPVTVTVPFNGTTATSFAVDCVERLGDLQVNTVTSGTDLDPDGYTVTVGGTQSQAITINGTAVFTGLTEGDHTVELTGLAANCSVSGANPATASVPYAATATITFTVDCATRTGDLELIVTTTGTDRDLNGYTVSIDDGARTRAIASNDTTSFADLTEGDHTVELTGIQTNCAVTGDHPATVTVPFEGTTSITLTVDCVERFGNLQVNTVSTGIDLDTSYTISVDQTLTQTAGANDSVTFTGLTEGTHVIEITGVAGNCTLIGERIVAISVPYQDTATHTYELTCTERLGELRITTATSGDDTDPDGYAVTVNDTLSLAIGINDALVVSGLHEGDHTVELSGVIANCTVTSTNPTSASVPYADTVTTAFTIDCATRTGDLDVSVTTTGADLDPDGYTVLVDGTQEGTVATNGPVTITGVTEGDHSVELADVAANCAVTSTTPVTVTVPYSGSTAASFTVNCVERLGDLEVTTATSGNDLDPNGYTVTVDGTQNQPIDTVDSVTFVDLDEGDHTVELMGLEGNCSVAGDNPAIVSVPYAAAGTITFTVDCVTRTGSLDVTTTTTGLDLDPDGYTVTVDSSVNQTVTANGTVTFTGLVEGNHSVELSGWAENCSLTSPSPVTVTVPFDGSANAGFTLDCVERLGDLDVTTVTTGTDLDPDGYTVSVGGATGQPIGLNETMTFTSLAEGDHSVELIGLAGNCAVSGANPASASVPYAATGTITMTVDCATRTGDLELMVTTTGIDRDLNGYTVSIDDGARTRAIASNDTTTFANLTEGTHTVELTDMQTNCAVTGDHPATVSVPFAGTVNLTLAVDCEERLGGIQVSTVTTGVDLDTAYTISVDQTQTQTAGPNNTVTFAALTEGTHVIEITGVAASCTLTGERLVAVTVPYQGTATHTYELTCTERLGDLQITTTTSGADVDPDGYTVIVDDTLSVDLGINDAVVLTGFHEGDHSVLLSGIASNCTVATANPATAAVPYADAVTTAFTVDCVTRTGDLDVSVTTTGADQDPDGYTVIVDGVPSESVATNGNVIITGLIEGDHTVALTGLAGNCTVTSTTPLTAAVSFDSTAAANFTVDCVARVGDLDVTTATAGSDLDPDGYTVTVDGTTNQAIGLNETVTITGLAEGDHSAELTGLEDNCTATGTNPVTVSVPYAGTATTTFTIDCVTRTGDLDVSVTTTGTDVDPDGYTVTVDSTTNQSVTINGTVTFAALTEGDHSVELSGVADNCSVTTANPTTATVPFNGTITASFTVDCVAQTDQ
jgi:hypothetical protein